MENKAANYQQGIDALNSALEDKQDIYDAFSTEQLGSISLIYGKAGNPNKQYSGGYGLAHIVAKRDYEHQQNPQQHRLTGKGVARKLIGVIVYGEVRRTLPAKQVVHIRRGKYEAVLSLDMHGNRVTWLLTGFRVIEEKNPRWSSKS